MRNSNTFGVHFALRANRSSKGKYPIYARIVINGTRCELALKSCLTKEDWEKIQYNSKNKSKDLKELASYFEEVRGKLARHYRELLLNNQEATAKKVKDAYLGLSETAKKKDYTLLWAVNEHNCKMNTMLKAGTMKNYHTTAKYLKAFIGKKYRTDDVYLKELNYSFISNFEHFVMSNSIKENDPCTNNGTMKHIERLKKIVAWAGKNEWIEKNPFINFHLKFDRHERECLNETELSVIKSYDFENPMLQKIRDLFIFSCYTGLAYIDLVTLKQHHLVRSVDGVTWIKNSREKTGVAVNVPLLEPALIIADKFSKEERAFVRDTVFPKISNQEMNRSLKVIAEICGIKKYLTFHLARHTFATTVTLMNGVPIETISKMLGHTKLSTTMIYAKVNQSKIGSDMELLQSKLNDDIEKIKLIAVK